MAEKDVRAILNRKGDEQGEPYDNGGGGVVGPGHAITLGFEIVIRFGNCVVGTLAGGKNRRC